MPKRFYFVMIIVAFSFFKKRKKKRIIVENTARGGSACTVHQLTNSPTPLNAFVRHISDFAVVLALYTVSFLTPWPKSQRRGG